MDGKVISVVNMKGGVGKTTTVVSLSETLSAIDQKPVLVADVDAQASASFCLAGDQVLAEQIRTNRTADAYFESALVNGPRRKLDELIRGQVSDVTHLGENLDLSLLASSPQLRVTEREIIYTLTAKKFSLAGIEGQTKRLLNDDVGALRSKYKYILFDGAPGISAFTQAAVDISDLVIVPTIPDFLSFYGLAAFINRVIGPGRTDHAQLPHVLITRRKQTRQHAEYEDKIRELASNRDSGFRVFDTVIPEMAALAAGIEMVGEYPRYTQKYTGRVSMLLSSLAVEVKGALQ